ncbi:hypothetical protein J45TS6_16560 [Paenibacillus sp. J45TS6]|uniref:hypothetical protein n=1 Tax=Paenibacillus sp. J45TS6 TaxID=2807196 RepID=UPI001B0B60FB|nr:hypothetical protein [Paenibacillus sp. J45TS6]GIP43197.1 hypothetical protein J45TS6_16560 [Paenibacillus sp. J45TS6]
MRAWVKATLFFSSLSPLFFILLVQMIDFEYIKKLYWTGKFSDWDFIAKIFTQPYIALAFLVLIILPNALLFCMMYYFKTHAPVQATITKVASKNGDVLNYIATYLIPFVSFKTDKINDLLAFILLMIILTIVYINANIYFINPFLTIMRYNIVEINGTYITICKGEFVTGDPINLYLIDHNVYIGVKK